MLIWPATRFVAGESKESAIAAVRDLNARGIAGSLDLLGENVTDRDAAARAREEYVALLRGIAAAGVDSNISIKLTMLGLDIERGVARDHLVAILEAARETDNWVRIDMEGSPYTQATLDLFFEVFESYPNVGIVIQSMLRRSDVDIDRLIVAGARVRLVKGAYKEPESIAFEDKLEVNAAFDRMAEKLLDRGEYPAIATHDDERIEHAIEYAGERGIGRHRFEFQMLYGVRRETQEAMVRRGFNMRVYVPYGKQWLPYFYRRLRERKENVSFVLRNLVRR
ncbi:MAG TPA: proline dehydrogenase family protein [Gemmatimonadota bacterium]|nr:proline dehydrogenase family protein [Gemmatimonadota bacterium]